jgi:hypothetical protein
LSVVRQLTSFAPSEAAAAAAAVAARRGGGMAAAGKSASAKALAAAQEVMERKLRPVYDAVDCRNYKLALKSINTIIQAYIPHISRCGRGKHRKAARRMCARAAFRVLGPLLTLPLPRADGHAETPRCAHRACAARCGAAAFRQAGGGPGGGERSGGADAD